jgi:hypothetical protein
MTATTMIEDQIARVRADGETFAGKGDCPERLQEVLTRLFGDEAATFPQHIRQTLAFHWEHARLTAEVGNDA